MRWFGLSISALACACGRLAFDPGADASQAPDGVISPASPCPIDSTTIFCDDFELPDFTRWAVNTNISRVASPVHTGTGAIRASIPVATAEAWLYAPEPRLASLPFFSLRFWAYVQADASLSQVNFITFSSGQNGQELTLLGYAGDYRLWRETSDGVGYGGAPIESEHWTCIELDVTVDNVNGAFELRVDGATAISQQGMDTLVDGDYQEMTIGLPYSNFTGQGAITIFYDDIHLGTRAVGCEP